MTWAGFVLDLAFPDDHKECGGYVFGRLRNQTRRLDHLVDRCAVVLDADKARPDFVDRVRALGYVSAWHTTWSHTPEKPRWRVVIPTARHLTRAEYEATADALMHELGRDQFDVPASRGAVQFMWRASTQDEEAYQHGSQDGALLGVVAAATPADAPPESPREQRTGGELDTYTRAGVAGELGKLAQALDMPLDTKDEAGDGWDGICYAVACNLIELANSTWNVYTLDQAYDDYMRCAPTDAGFLPKRQKEKWKSARQGVGDKARPNPYSTAADDFDPVDDGDTPSRLEDAHLAAWMAHRGLRDDWRWAGGLGWLHWDGRRWALKRHEDVAEAVRQEVIAINKRALDNRATPDRMKALNSLLTSGKINTVASLMRGVVSVDIGAFDQKPDLLNVGNGVVNLRTGELLPHDRKHLLTKITETPYVPGATHPDWTKALTALDGPVADWMQVRFGQAATGYPTSDDVLPVGQGGGSNGKSTLLSALFTALGGHVAQIPEKLLRGKPGDHPTELMTLQGARIAVIDETPEAGRLDVQRLKAVVGQEWMTARAIQKDNVTWRATHSLFVMTNYEPQVVQSDHGTWRRLRLVRFTKTFPKDDRFRAAMTRGQAGRREAVLAWVVQGARRWYDAGKAIPEAPERVLADTRTWRSSTDQVLGYVSERLVFEYGACVTTADMLVDFNDWQVSQGNAKWSAKTLASRFGGHEEVTGHGVEKSQMRNPPGLVRLPGEVTPAERPHVWRGVRWRASQDGD